MATIHWCRHGQHGGRTWSHGCICEMQQNHTHEEWEAARAELEESQEGPTGPERVRAAIERDRGGALAPTQRILFSGEDHELMDQDDQTERWRS